MFIYSLANSHSLTHSLTAALSPVYAARNPLSNVSIQVTTIQQSTLSLPYYLTTSLVHKIGLSFANISYLYRCPSLPLPHSLTHSIPSTSPTQWWLGRKRKKTLSQSILSKKNFIDDLLLLLIFLLYNYLILFIDYCLLSIVYCLLFIVYCLLSIAYCLLSLFIVCLGIV